MTQGEDIAAYLPIVNQVVARYSRRGLPPTGLRDDLWSAGVAGLMDALRRFDATAGAPFECYARIRIQGAIQDELRKMDWVPRRVRMAARLRGEALLSPFLPLDYCFADSGATLAEIIKDENDQPAREIMEKADAIAAVNAAVGRLPAPQRRVVTLYFFESMKMPAIAAVLGITSARVGQILRAALDRLARWLRSGPDAIAA
jgi:RNA polymerase sigma factor for flagellar operon FliA